MTGADVGKAVAVAPTRRRRAVRPADARPDLQATQVTGNLDQDQAAALAAQLDAGTLYVDFVVTWTTTR